MQNNTKNDLGKKLFSMVVVADTHLSEQDMESNSPFAVNRLANGRMKHVVQDINALKPDFVINLGDLIHPVPGVPNAYADAVERFLEQTAELNCPQYLVPGNHDEVMRGYLGTHFGGIEVMQTAAPQASAPSQVTLDTISYSAEGEVLLRGTAADGAAVRVYLDNEPVTDLDTNAKGRFRGKIGAAEPGIYTLRLDEVDTDGQVLSRLETPFKRESPEVLQPAEGTSEETESPVRAVTVQTGDTLWAISRDRYGDGVLYVKVVEANRDSIKNPDLIYPGQVFAIPE
mgnify:CR=1 FL=1